MTTVKDAYYAAAARARALATYTFKTRRPVTVGDDHVVVNGERVHGYSSTDRYIAAVLEDGARVEAAELAPGHWSVVLVLDEGYVESWVHPMVDYHRAVLHETARSIADADTKSGMGEMLEVARSLGSHADIRANATGPRHLDSYALDAAEFLIDTLTTDTDKGVN